MPAHRIAYNKAAGADARERTLRSYVEGHFKSERNESTGRSRPIGLRTGGRTYSVIVGVFANDGYDETVTLAQVFQQRDSAGQPYRFFVTAQRRCRSPTDFADFGTDLRDLRKRLRASGAEIFDEFPKYAVSLKRLLGIRSDQALELFHQTVSMKSVGNLNDFVRDHMLEPSDCQPTGSATSSATSTTSPRLTTRSNAPANSSKHLSPSSTTSEVRRHPGRKRHGRERTTRGPALHCRTPRRISSRRDRSTRRRGQSTATRTARGTWPSSNA